MKSLMQGRYGQLLALTILALPLQADDIDFNRQIRPILSDKCYTCHGPDSAKRKTTLRFDREDSAKAALANGKWAIVPSHPEKSEMLARVTSPDKALRMPPAYMGKDPLSAKEIALLIPNLLILFRGLARDPRVPRRSKWLLVIGAVWIASPIDLIPEFIPVLGPLDDAVVAALILRHLLRPQQ